VAATCEHTDSASSSTRLQLIGGGGDSGEPGKYNLDTPGLTVLEDPGAKAAPPGAALPAMLASVSHTTKSYNKLLALSPSQVLASAALAPTAPCGTSIADATTGR
jgi:hypothetical protein